MTTSRRLRRDANAALVLFASSVLALGACSATPSGDGAGGTSDTAATGGTSADGGATGVASNDLITLPDAPTDAAVAGDANLPSPDTTGGGSGDTNVGEDGLVSADTPQATDLASGELPWSLDTTGSPDTTGTVIATCSELIACTNTCVGGSDSGACFDACGDKALPAAKVQYNAIVMCIDKACPDATDTCLTAAQEPGGACYALLKACEGQPLSGCGECYTGTLCGADPANVTWCQAADCGAITFQGTCFGATNDKVVYCGADGKLTSIDCAVVHPGGAQYTACAEIPTGKGGTLNRCACVPKCGPLSCGDDGCGGTCAACSAGYDCKAGECVKCVPQCNGNKCGPDGCGGDCGVCTGAQESCSNGQCVCAPKCDAGSCGSDGCGAKCSCKSGETCTNDKCAPTDPCVAAPDGCACLIGKCQPSPAAAICTGVSKACQYAIANDYKANGCKTCNSIAFPGLKALCTDSACSGDLANVKLTAPTICDPKCFCTPNCTNKTCGDDGCGGTCGSPCTAGKSCDAGKCVDSCSLTKGRPLFCACSDKGQCNSNACAEVNGKSICSHLCTKDSDCEAGSGCKFSVTIPGVGTYKYCTP